MSMKLKLIGAFLIGGCLSLSARTWTSADGKMAVEGDFKSFDSDANKVTLEVEGNEVVFDLAKLSAGDQTFVKTKAKGGGEVAIADMLAKTPLYQLEGGEMKKVSFEAKPKYFLVYYSASW